MLVANLYTYIKYVCFWQRIISHNLKKSTNFHSKFSQSTHRHIFTVWRMQLLVLENGGRSIPMAKYFWIFYQYILWIHIQSRRRKWAIKRILLCNMYLVFSHKNNQKFRLFFCTWWVSGGLPDVQDYSQYRSMPKVTLIGRRRGWIL